MQTSSRGITSDEREKLRSHVVNLRQGRFSTDGDFITTRQDVEHLFAVDLPAALDEAKAAHRKLRVLFYAHGGLVSESAGIAGALSQVDFWKGNHIFPIFFVWETGILEVIADDLRKQLLGQRGVTDFIKEAQARLFESLARPGGLRASLIDRASACIHQQSLPGCRSPRRRRMGRCDCLSEVDLRQGAGDSRRFGRAAVQHGAACSARPSASSSAARQSTANRCSTWW